MANIVASLTEEDLLKGSVLAASDDHNLSHQLMQVSHNIHKDH